MFATHHCQLNRLMIRGTLNLANLAFCGHHHVPGDEPIPTLNRPCLTVTDVLISGSFITVHQRGWPGLQQIP